MWHGILRRIHERILHALWLCGLLVGALILSGASDAETTAPSDAETTAPPLIITQILEGRRMHKDAKAVMITGRATGQDGEPGYLSVYLNGVEFTVTTYSGFSPHYYADDEGESALDSCEALLQQIAAYTRGRRGTPEFDTQCLSLAGEAALLLVQANPETYKVPSTEKAEAVKWLKKKRRLLHLRVRSTDDNQGLVVK